MCCLFCNCCLELDHLLCVLTTNQRGFPGGAGGDDSDDELINLLATQSVEVELQHVSLTLKKDPGTEILHDVSGHM